MEIRKSLLELSEILAEKRDKREELETELEPLVTDIQAIQAEMLQIMQDDDVPKFTHVGRTFSIRNDAYPGPIEGKKEELYAALKEHGYDELFTVGSQKFRGFISDLTEKGEKPLPAWLAALTDPGDRPTISVRKGTSTKNKN